MNALVDAAILVDLLRTYPPALAWLEVINGAENKVKRNQALDFLR